MLCFLYNTWNYEIDGEPPEGIVCPHSVLFAFEIAVVSSMHSCSAYEFNLFPFSKSLINRLAGRSGLLSISFKVSFLIERSLQNRRIADNLFRLRKLL